MSSIIGLICVLAGVFLIGVSCGIKWMLHEDEKHLSETAEEWLRRREQV